MEKALIGLVFGVFLGAFVTELYRRAKPPAAKRLEDRAAKATQAVVAAFREGYSSSSEVDEQVR